MQSAPIGQKVHAIGVNPVTVADGTKGRCVLIDPNPQYKHIAWDPELKRRTEVDQDMCIKYGLTPQLRFYYLVARLNTDMAGNIVNDQFVVEYLPLSESINNTFADALVEMPNFTHIVLQKVVKKGENNKDYSYISPIPSGQPLPQSIVDNITKMRSNPAAIQALWQLVDRATSVSIDEYKKLKAASPAGPALPPPTPAAAIAPGNVIPQSSPMPQAPAIGEDPGFGVGEEFDKDFQ